MGTVTPNTSTVPVGRIDGACFAVVPKESSTAPWATRRTPIDAAIFASGDAVRSGRKATSSMSAPTISTTRRVMTSAGAVGISGPKNPVFSAQNEYPATIANAPTARLMIPDPR